MKNLKQEIPHLAHIFDRIDDQGRFDSYEMTKLDRMSVGRAVLIGDSGHPMPPTLGQGAGCAIMNALGLAVAIEEAGDDLLDGLRVWERRERPLTEHTQDISVRRLGVTHSATASPCSVVSTAASCTVGEGDESTDSVGGWRRWASSSSSSSENKVETLLLSSSSLV